jgi:DNA-directed RNA polymerase specialized sigma24 family protein
MPEAKHIMRPTPYASCADFQRIFDEDMKSLYLLSFLLTADQEKAEQCFVSGLDDAVEGNPVFMQWARSWARRAIIQNAVRGINPRPIEGSNHSNSAFWAGNGETNSNGKTPVTEQQVEIAAVLGLDPFERFVYVMKVLERYSDQDCSLLLSCSRRDVAAARTRALQQIGSATALHYQQLPNASSEKRAPHELRSSGLQLLIARV